MFGASGVMELSKRQEIVRQDPTGAFEPRAKAGDCATNLAVGGAAVQQRESESQRLRGEGADGVVDGRR
jgi:hypothetical protein